MSNKRKTRRIDKINPAYSTVSKLTCCPFIPLRKLTDYTCWFVAPTFRDLVLVAPKNRFLIIDSSTNHTTSVARIPSGISSSFPIRVRVPQDSALSPLLFTLCMCSAGRPATMQVAGQRVTPTTVRTSATVERQAAPTRPESQHMAKTELAHNQTEISADTMQLEAMYFKCLGSTINVKGDITPKVRTRIKTTWLSGWCQVNDVLCVTTQ